MKKIYYSFLILLLIQCTNKEANITIVDEGFVAPSNFPSVLYNFNENPYSNEKRELGRKLFYDTRLSRDNTISCGSCHQQAAFFAHAGHRISHGIENKLGTRNSPALFNMAWQSSFFWDGGVGDLDFFHVNPIQNPVEMDETIPNIIEKLKTDNNYLSLFKNVFGTSEITPVRFNQALSIFLVSIVSNQSKYDDYLAGKVALTADEAEGLQLFNQKCADCHSGILFTDFSFRNNGLETTPDLGRYRVSVIDTDSFKFKVPSLRNIEKTSPYMHDGRFTTLDEVLNHYSAGVVNTTTTLDAILQSNTTLGIPLTDAEKNKIISFLKTLTDTKLLNDTRFSEI
ncbi:MAG: cytochrome-c peroxidase [Sphingobacteriales bacterium]|jgi:cytochrome c peroxidase|nr:MAG: cytochrome-c peroxidase [Sphingobacteriales bacterium]